MPDVVKSRGYLKLIDGLSVLAFVIFFIFNIHLIDFIWKDLPPNAMGDYMINADVSRNIASTHSYPQFFLYPPFYVILVSSIAAAGAKAGFFIWIGLIFFATLGSLYGILKLLDRDGQPGFLTAALLGLLAVGYFVQWDIRAFNVNIIYLAVVILSLVLARSNHKLLAGMALAMSVGTKIYSIVLLPWMLWTGEWRWLFWTMIGLAVVLIGIPMLWFGSDGFVVIRSWIGAAIVSGNSAYQEVFPGYLISVHTTVAKFLRRSATDESVILIARSVQAIWIVLIGAYFLLSWRGNHAARTRMAADAGVLVLLPLLLSTLVQPHHGAVMLLPAAVMAIVAADPGSPKSLRISLAGLLFASLILPKVAPKGDLRGIALIGTALILLAGMALVRAKSD